MRRADCSVAVGTVKDSALVHVVRHRWPGLWGLAALAIVVLVIQGVLVPWTLLAAAVAAMIGAFA